jgi:hypothetical protein
MLLRVIRNVYDLDQLMGQNQIGTREHACRAQCFNQFATLAGLQDTMMNQKV